MDDCRVCNIVRLVGERRYPLTAALTTASVIVLAWPTVAVGTALVLAKRHAATKDDALMRRCLERDTDLVREAIALSFGPKSIMVERSIGVPHGHEHVIPVYTQTENVSLAKPDCCRDDAPPGRLEDKQRVYDALATFRGNLAKLAFQQGRSDLRIDLLQESSFPPPPAP